MAHMKEFGRALPTRRPPHHPKAITAADRRATAALLARALAYADVGKWEQANTTAAQLQRVLQSLGVLAL
jgi:hypothetical protein